MDCGLIIYYYFYLHRVYSNFTLETILATAFGRRIDLQRGESDQFSKSMELLISGFTDGQLEQFVLFHSKFNVLQWNPDTLVRNSMKCPD